MKPDTKRAAPAFDILDIGFLLPPWLWLDRLSSRNSRNLAPRPPLADGYDPRPLPAFEQSPLATVVRQRKPGRLKNKQIAIQGPRGLRLFDCALDFCDCKSVASALKDAK
jgi:hypothetical protein